MGSCNSAARKGEIAGGIVGGALLIAAGLATGGAGFAAAGGRYCKPWDWWGGVRYWVDQKATRL